MSMTWTCTNFITTIYDKNLVIYPLATIEQYEVETWIRMIDGRIVVGEYLKKSFDKTLALERGLGSVTSLPLTVSVIELK